jgi:hypothetical protein
MLSDACVSLLPRFVIYLYSFVVDLRASTMVPWIAMRQFR